LSVRTQNLKTKSKQLTLLASVPPALCLTFIADRISIAYNRYRRSVYLIFIPVKKNAGGIYPPAPEKLYVPG